jgi:murein L,D-transpeptidase YcbB/YkuD
VNVPAYRLQIVEDGDPVLAMRVVVGSPEDQTPVFSDLMTYVVFSPYWNIPESILREETLPRASRDPGYLERNRIEVVRHRNGKVEKLDPARIDWADEAETRDLSVRQLPGPENALGRVKFIFPNHFAVYLHDTPAHDLFAKQERAFSHGCVRVEDPTALARYVLGDRPEWTAERTASAMGGDTERTVKLQRPLPVHIGYWTAWVEDDGTVTYTSDPYGIDRAHARVLGIALESAAPPREAAGQPGTAK